MQYTSKMKMRNVPVLVKYYEQAETAPQCIALGFAAYILFMKPVKQEEKRVYGQVNNLTYHIQDDQAAYVAGLWQTKGQHAIVAAILEDTCLWDIDLSQFPGFSVAVNEHLQSLILNGAIQTLTVFQQNKVLA